MPLELTAVAEIVTTNPELVHPGITVLEASRVMHGNTFLTPPVCENDRSGVGLVMGMDVIYGCGGAEGWRSVFSSSLHMDDVSDTVTVHRGIGRAAGQRCSLDKVEEVCCRKAAECSPSFKATSEGAVYLVGWR